MRDERRRPRGSETERGAHRDHRRAAGVDGVDDLGVVDALEVDRGDAEVAVSKLALNDDQGHAFAGHLDGVGVAELVWGEPSSHAGSGGGLTKFLARRGVGPVPSTRRSGEDAEQRSDWKLEPSLKPGLQLLPAPGVHADLASAATFAVTHEHGPAAWVEINFGE